MSWSGWYLRNSSISAILRSVIGVVTPFRLLVVLLLEGNAPVTFSVNHRPDSTGFYTLPGTLTGQSVKPTASGGDSRRWNEERFFAALAERNGPAEAEVARAILDWARGRQLQ